MYLKSAGGNTPLEWGVLWNRPTSIGKMLEFHAQREDDTMGRICCFQRIVHIFMSNIFFIYEFAENICNKEKLLYLALRNNQMKSFHYLLSKGANPNICNNDGLPLLCGMILVENIPIVR